MKLDRLLSRLRSIKYILSDPERKKGTSYRGMYQLKGRCVEGWVVRNDRGLPCPPEFVTISYCDKVIATIREFTDGTPRWQFVFDTGSDITASDVLQERFKVAAVNNLGQQLALRPEGKMQVAYIREIRPGPDVELTIDFAQGGNAGPYLREGWGTRESKFTRTEGKVSFMEIPVSEPQANYRIEMHLRPFIVPGKLPAQDVDVYVNDFLVSRSSVRGTDESVTFEVPKDLVVDQSIKLRFDLPEASRPSDLIPDHKNKRVLAVAFEKLVLSRVDWIPDA